MCGLGAIRAAWGLLNWEPLRNDSGVSGRLRATPGAARSPTNDEARPGVPGPSCAPSSDPAPAGMDRPTTPSRRLGRGLGTESRPPVQRPGQGGESRRPWRPAARFWGHVLSPKMDFPLAPDSKSTRGAVLSRGVPLGTQPPARCPGVERG